MRRCKKCNQPLYETRRFYDYVSADGITEDVPHVCYAKLHIATEGIVNKHHIFIKRLAKSATVAWQRLAVRRATKEEVWTPAMMSPLEIAMRWELHNRMKRGVR